MFDGMNDKEVIFKMLNSDEFSRYFADYDNDIVKAIKVKIAGAVADITDVREAQQVLWDIVEHSVKALNNQNNIARDSNLLNDQLNQQNFWQHITPPLLRTKKEIKALGTEKGEGTLVANDNGETSIVIENPVKYANIPLPVTKHEVEQSVKQHLHRDESMQKNSDLAAKLTNDDIANYVIDAGFSLKDIAYYADNDLSLAKNYCLEQKVIAFSYPHLTGMTQIEKNIPLSLIDCNYALLASRSAQAKIILDTLEQDKVLYQIQFKDEDITTSGVTKCHHDIYTKIQVDDITYLPVIMHELSHAFMYHKFGTANPYHKDDKSSKERFDDVLYKTLLNCYLKLKDKSAVTTENELTGDNIYKYDEINLGKIIAVIEGANGSVYGDIHYDRVLSSFKSMVSDYNHEKYHAELIVRYFELSVDPIVDKYFLNEIAPDLADYATTLFPDNQGGVLPQDDHITPKYDL